MNTDIFLFVSVFGFFQQSLVVFIVQNFSLLCIPKYFIVFDVIVNMIAF